jgi:hypothetical protein
MMVLHCTEAPLASTLAHFQTPGGKNPVSAHYVIDRNDDIYQMVRHSDSAWHCMGANKSSIGIEHVGRTRSTRRAHCCFGGPYSLVDRAIHYSADKHLRARFYSRYCRPGGTGARTNSLAPRMLRPQSPPGWQQTSETPHIHPAMQNQSC